MQHDGRSRPGYFQHRHGPEKGGGSEQAVT